MDLRKSVKSVLSMIQLADSWEHGLGRCDGFARIYLTEDVSH